MLSATGEYALRIMIHLAEAQGEPLISDKIAEATKVPADYAVKVLQLLGRAKMVSGKRGRRGGFSLRCDPNTTTLLDVVNVIDPLERITACPLGRKAHRRKLCPLHTSIDEVIELLQDSLSQMTLQSVIDGTPGPALCRQASTDLTVSARGSTRSKAKPRIARRKKKAKSTSRSKKRTRVR